MGKSETNNKRDSQTAQILEHAIDALQAFILKSDYSSESY